MTRELEIVVVGGGIAGLSAGLAGARLGRSTLVLTGDTLGGHLLNIERIDGYPGFPDGAPGYDLCPAVQEQAAAAGAAFEMTPVSGFSHSGRSWQIETAAGGYSAQALILAAGTTLRALDVPGEVLLAGKGVSQCASCDAPLLRDKAVVVAGGGDSALQEALTLAEHCSKVTVVHHGPTFTGQKAYRDLATENARITPVPESEISEILGDDAVSGVNIRSIDNDAVSELECAAVFVFVGLQAATSFVEDRSILDDSGCVVTDTALRTGQPGLFAAGTIRAGCAGRATAAAGEGTAAAVAADRWLASGNWPG